MSLLSPWLALWEKNKGCSRFLSAFICQTSAITCVISKRTCPSLHITLCKLDARHNNTSPNSHRELLLSLSLLGWCIRPASFSSWTCLWLFCNISYYGSAVWREVFAYVNSAGLLHKSVSALTLRGHHLALVCLQTSHSALFAFSLHLFFFMSAAVLRLYLSAVRGKHQMKRWMLKWTQKRGFVVNPLPPSVFLLLHRCSSWRRSNWPRSCCLPSTPPQESPGPWSTWRGQCLTSLTFMSEIIWTNTFRSCPSSWSSCVSVLTVTVKQNSWARLWRSESVCSLHAERRRLIECLKTTRWDEANRKKKSSHIKLWQVVNWGL